MVKDELLTHDLCCGYFPFTAILFFHITLDVIYHTNCMNDNWWKKFKLYLILLDVLVLEMIEIYILQNFLEKLGSDCIRQKTFIFDNFCIF